MTTLRRAVWSALLVLTLAIAAPVPLVAIAGAAEHGAAEHHEAGHHAAGVGDLLFPAINFAVYLVIVVRYVIPAMREYLRRRQADIVQAKAESEAALTQAERALAASKGRLAGLAAERDAIRQDLIAIATRQGERLKSQAEETGTRRLADASLLGEQERRRALATLRADLAKAAADLAQEKIRGALTAADQRAFVQQFLKEAAAR